MKLLPSLNSLLDGEKKVSDEKKYRLLAVCTGIVHLMLVFVFCYIGSIPMMMYNAFSFLGYMACLPLVNDGKLSVVFGYICVEVPLHCFLAIHAAGWDFGFAMYLIAIVPVGFEMSFALNNTSRGIKLSLLLGIVNFVTFMSCRLYSYFNEPLYTVDNEIFVQTVYLINVFSTFMLLIIYSFLFVTEITAAQQKLRQKNAELATLAAIDPLTGFYNRRKMHEYLYGAAKGDGTFSLIMGDIDNFKSLNDTYGHDCGDEALRAVSEVFRDCLPEGDKICRWGGEEFLMLTCRPLEDAAGVAEKIRAAVESHHLKFGDNDIQVTLTLGVSQYDPSSTVDKTITSADKKLYQGKSSGKNCVVK